MKGILLAGGAGSRLYPLTKVSSKQLQAVYDKPMVYYPLTVLIAAGIREICLIATPEDIDRYRSLLGDGEQWGIEIFYRIQARPEGIAQALVLAEEFVGDSNVTLMLGDNIFSGSDDIPRAISEFHTGATVFAYRVSDPKRFGVVEFDSNLKAISLEEKPSVPKSSYAVPGLYIYDKRSVEIAKGLQPGARGELEITDVNLEYLKDGMLSVKRLSRGFAWLDAGTSASLFEAGAYVEAIESRQGIKIGCPEEAAFTRNFINESGLEALIQGMPNCEYRTYLMKVLSESKDGYIV